MKITIECDCGTKETIDLDKITIGESGYFYLFECVTEKYETELYIECDKCGRKARI